MNCGYLGIKLIQRDVENDKGYSTAYIYYFYFICFQKRHHLMNKYIWV